MYAQQGRERLSGNPLCMRIVGEACITFERRSGVLLKTHKINWKETSDGMTMLFMGCERSS